MRVVARVHPLVRNLVVLSIRTLQLISPPEQLQGHLGLGLGDARLAVAVVELGLTFFEYLHTVQLEVLRFGKSWLMLGD